MTTNNSTVWDPLRKKEVPLTPEERVRQWCIGMLHTSMNVPLHMMMSETGFKLGNKQFRADIIIYGRSAEPVAIVECKRPEVAIDNEVIDQTIRYNMVLDVTFIIITNGNKTYIFRKSDGRYKAIGYAPTYEEMLLKD